MEDRQIYEIIMKTQCEEYRQMLLLINKIIRADDSLRNASLKQPHEYDIDLIHDITMQKEAWIKELDRLSFNVPRTIKLLSDYQFSIYELEKSSIYQQMKLLEGKCQAKIDYYLKNEEERERIARNGYEKVRKNHTFLSRAREL